MKLPQKENLIRTIAKTYTYKNGEMSQIYIELKDKETGKYFSANYQSNGLNSLYWNDGNVLKSCKYDDVCGNDGWTQEQENEILDYIKENNPHCFDPIKPKIHNNGEPLRDDYDNEGKNPVRKLLSEYAMYQMPLHVVFSEPTKIKGMRTAKKEAKLMFFMSTSGDVCVTGAKRSGSLINNVNIISIN